MKLKLTNILKEIETEDSKEKLVQEINSSHKGLLNKAVGNINFIFQLGKEVEYDGCGISNKCETNVFSYIKEKISKGDYKHFPVGGFIFVNDSLTPIEHWWIYDGRGKDFVEISPMKNLPICYAGIVNFDIQKEIQNVNSVFDVDFFKGGNVYSKYFK